MMHRTTPSTYYTADLTFRPDKVLLNGLPGGLLQLDIHGGQLSIDHPNYTVAISVENKGPTETTAKAEPSPTDFEAMWEDCRQHRDQAERRARHYMDIVRAIESIVAADEEAGAI